MSFLLYQWNLKSYCTLISVPSGRFPRDVPHLFTVEKTTLYMRTSLKTLKKHLPYIETSFIYPYNNGRMEGINNKIKVLNRVAYGYRNFMNYKKRILIHFKFNPLESEPRQGQSQLKVA